MKASSPLQPDAPELEALFIQKYGGDETTGWAPQRRFRFRYYLPAEVYECLVSKCVTAGCSWIDVGGGSSIFPENPTLARELASRCARVVAVDPSENVLHNPFVHEAVCSSLETYNANRPFDVATLRMVVEHVNCPEEFLEALSRVLRPGGTAIVLTVNSWSPIPLVSRLVPFRLHHAIKKRLWGGDEKDTFPVHYRMNTRKRLRRLFEGAGFEECAFVQPDDLSTFGLFKRLNYVELVAWRLLTALGLRYPENCLLGVYKKRSVNDHA